MSETMPSSYTVERAKQELRELGVEEEKINSYSFKGIESPLPKEYGGPCCTFGDAYTDKNGKYHYICYCPTCKKLRFTNRSACMCGSCETCGYRWTCMPYSPPLSLTTETVGFTFNLPRGIKLADEVSFPVNRCARCGDNHKQVSFKKLTRPSDEWTHWAKCPNLGEPILFKIL